MPLSKEEEKARMDTFEYQTRRATAFQRVFSGADGELVYKELGIQCKANSLLVSIDQFQTSVNAAKRDIWTFIQNAMNQDVETARKTLAEHRKNMEEKKEE